MLRVFIFLLACACALPALAHKASDAYLQLQSSDAGLTLRLDVALRDLDAALDLDADGDGRLTWGEVRSAQPGMARYALDHVQVDNCPLRVAGQGLEQRSDGAYAVLNLASDCVPAAAPALRYTLLADVDPTHRGIARIAMPGRAAELRVLDPASAGPSAAPADKVALQSAGSDAGGVAVANMDAGTQATASTSFLREGVVHILGGYDHVLFLLCLLLPAAVRRTPTGWRAVPRLRDAVLPLVGVVTAFTLAHSVTLALAALQWVTISPAVIEPAIAATIVLAAIDNVWPIFGGRRAVVTFVFGLVHGFGFAGVLGELDLPAAQFAWALLQFNLGLELGQLLIVMAATGVLFLLRHQPAYPRWGIGAGSAAAMAMGVLWFVERTANVAILPW